MTHLHTQDPVVVPPGGGRAIPGPEGLVVKAGGDDTGGSVAILEATSPPGFAAPPHVHHENEELFYVLEGTFSFLLGDERVTAGPGTFVLVPRGVPHSPGVVGDEPGRVIIGFAPAGAERAFDEFAALAAELGDAFHPAHERVQAVARRYGSEFVEPPA